MNTTDDDTEHWIEVTSQEICIKLGYPIPVDTE